MQAPSEALMLEEHQTGGPSFMSQQVCLCTDHFLCTFVYISFSDLVLEETQIGDPLPPQGTCIFVDIGIYIYIYIFLCSLIVSKWCKKSTQSGSLLVRHQDP